MRCQEVLLVTLDAFCALSSRTLSPCWVIKALSVSAERADTDVDGTDTPGFQSMPVATLKSDFNVNSFLTSVSITSWNKLHTRLKFLGPLCWLTVLPVFQMCHFNTKNILFSQKVPHHKHVFYLTFRAETFPSYQKYNLHIYRVCV